MSFQFGLLLCVCLIPSLFACRHVLSYDLTSLPIWFPSQSIYMCMVQIVFKHVVWSKSMLTHMLIILFYHLDPNLCNFALHWFIHIYCVLFHSFCIYMWLASLVLSKYIFRYMNITWFYCSRPHVYSYICIKQCPIILILNPYMPWLLVLLLSCPGLF